MVRHVISLGFVVALLLSPGAAIANGIFHARQVATPAMAYEQGLGRDPDAGIAELNGNVAATLPSNSIRALFSTKNPTAAPQTAAVKAVPAAVPESYALVLAGIVCVAFVSRRRRNRG